MIIHSKYEEITVACVLWVGGFRKRPYSPVWVQRLRSMVARNLKIPHNFVCLSNTEVKGIDCIPLKHKRPGWWSKTELFRPDIPGDRVLYFDLDLIILDDLQPFINQDGKMIICKAHGKGKSGNGIVHGYNSSVMVFDVEKNNRLYWYFDAEDMKQYRGDQDYIKAMMPHLPTFPEGWVDKMRNCMDKTHRKCSPKSKTKVLLCMPYKNDKAIRKFDWVREIWK